MDYGKLFTRAWDIIWKNKFLILLGVLVALSGSSGGNGGTQSRFVFQDGEVPWNSMPQFDYGAPFRNLDLSILAIVGILTLIIVLFLVGLAFWVVGTISRGGMISAVNDIETGKPSNFSSAFQAGWKKGWRLIGIDLIPSIPGWALLFGGVIVFLSYGGFGELMEGVWPYAGMGPFLPLILLSCLLLPVIFFLSLLQTFAVRACMLEDLGVIASYKRGFKVLADNIGPALILFLIQIAVSIGLFIVLIIPGFLMALCCLLWPLLILIQGATTAYITTLWTLAWREWVGESELQKAELEEVNK
jgi:hypothetical protein